VFVFGPDDHGDVEDLVVDSELGFRQRFVGHGQFLLGVGASITDHA